jgi:ATP-dependent helicase/DNAse subunit B
VKFKHFLTKNTVINGTIDNFVTIDDKYFICIDYKTGSTKFDENKLQYGLSTQLPTYALLTLSNEKYKDLELAGLYINNVLTSSLFVKKEDDELIPGYLKLNGKTIGDLNAVAKIDSTVIDGKSSFISGVALKSDGSGLKEVKSIVSPFAFEEYVQKVKDLYIDMDAKLRNNEFDIKPIFFSSRDNACMYCPYRDVCFVRREQFDDKSGGEDEDE